MGRSSAAPIGVPACFDGAQCQVALQGDGSAMRVNSWGGLAEERQRNGGHGHEAPLTD